ncbi:hypothetical protein [Nocardia shimofusensis]|uniref:hypothetical protein n=1 Tax=Nocardia shimofusensis TaxID=228596 RepID=UPI00082F096A|nr:hypothetical protein [Nocardia shimofusensis]
MARTREWQDSEAWPQAWPEDQDPEDPFIADSRPIVNPYAVIALVAALLALFPVAIVFGLIAFGHPRGRAMATFAVLLGIAEAAAVAAVVVLTGSSLTDTLADLEDATATGTTVTATSTADQTTAAQAPPAELPSARPTPASTTEEAPLVRKGAACTAGQLGMIGSAVDGGTLLCLEAAGASGAHQWSGPYNIGTGVFEPGRTCDETIAKSGRTADGRALVCESQGTEGVWVRWTN